MSKDHKKVQGKAVSTALADIIKDRGWERKIDQHRIFVDWQSIVEEEIALHAHPLKVVKDVLWLEVENSAWIQQFQYQKYYLLEQLNEHLSVAHFADIRFVVGEKGREPSGQTQQTLAYIPPAPERVEKFRAQISAIEDEDIRESLMRLWYLSQACRKREG